MIATHTWLPKLRAVTPLVLLMFQLNYAVGLADDQLNDDSEAHGPVVEERQDDDELQSGDELAADELVDDESTEDRLVDEQVTDENIVLSVSSMPLSVFATAIEEGMSISIEVDESIADFTVDGQFNGSIEYLLADLQERYGISHSVSGNVYELWRDSDFSSQVSYQFQLSDMDLVAFLSYLSEAAGYRLIADTSINITVDGAYNGTLRDTINALSHQYPVLFYISEDTISVVPESSFVKSVVSLSEDNYSPDAFLTDLRTTIPPGNFVNREDNQLIVGGHPDFVRRTELELKIDMSDSALIIPELLTTKFPVVPARDDITRVDQPVSEQEDNSADNVPLVLFNQQHAIAATQDSEVAIVSVQDANDPITLEQDTEVVVEPIQDVDAAVMSEQDSDVAASLEKDADDVVPEQDAGNTATLEQGADNSVPEHDAVVAVTKEQDAKDSVIPERGADKSLLEQAAEDALSLKQDNEVAATPESADDSEPQQDADSTDTQGQDAEVAAASEPEPEPEPKPKPKPKKNVPIGSVDQIPGFY